MGGVDFGVSRNLAAIAAALIAVALAAYGVRVWLGRGAETPPPVEGTYRIASWNLGWMLEEVGEARCARVRSVVEQLSPHVLAIQEVESKAAALRVLPTGYEVTMIDDPREEQELALAVRKPFRLVGEAEMHYAESRHDDAFPSRRNTISVLVDGPGGERFRFYVVHYKSRSGGRLETDAARVGASRLLLDLMRSRNDNQVVVLGDFNDTPGDRSVNVLESGEYNPAGDDPHPGRHLVNLFQPLYEADYVSQGFFRAYRGSVAEPVMRGASADNERLRGVDYRFPRDVKVTQALFDQILVSPGLSARVASVGVFVSETALKGTPTEVRQRSDDTWDVARQGTLPSDHLPVFADIRF